MGGALWHRKGFIEQQKRYEGWPAKCAGVRGYPITNLTIIPSNEIHRVLPFVEEEIDRAIAIAGDRYSEGEIEGDLKNGKRQLWLITGDEIMGVVVTRIYRTGVCQIELCAGHDINQWLHHLEKIEQWAKARNCTDIEVVGRKGWQRMLKGYDLEAVILRKKL